MNPENTTSQLKNQAYQSLSSLYLAVPSNIAQDVNETIKRYINALEAEITQLHQHALDNTSAEAVRLRLQVTELKGALSILEYTHDNDGTASVKVFPTEHHVVTLLAQSSNSRSWMTLDKDS